MSPVWFADQIRHGLEKNYYTDYQRRITYIKYLGEFYNYRVVDSQVHSWSCAFQEHTRTVLLCASLWPTLPLLACRTPAFHSCTQTIFDTLYLVITFGEGTDLDPPNDFFRIRLVCVLLSTCGEFFDTVYERGCVPLLVHKRHSVSPLNWMGVFDWKGDLAKRLKKFMAYFHRYIFLKDPMPVDIEFQVHTLSSVSECSDCVVACEHCEHLAW